VGLSTGTRIDTAAVEAICCLQDDLYRLRWVSYAYHDLSERLTEGLGQNASWPSFARWSAYTISEALRIDRPNPRLEELLAHHALPPKVVRPLVEVQKRMRSLDHGAMPTVMALGNRMVFHEIGWTMAEFLAWIETQTARDPDAWARYHAQIKPFESTDFFRPGYAEWLRDGVGAYYEAWWETNPAKKAQLVLRGNILLGAYEQWRVDSFFRVALDFNPGALVKELRVRQHDQMSTQPVGVRHAGTRRALRHQWAALDWMADAYAAFLTRFVLTWDAPLDSEKPTALRLGCDVPSRRQAALKAQNLEELDADVARLFATFDRSGGEVRGSGARNWRRFTDRMSFIVNLFRAQQQNPNLRVEPSFLEKRLLELRLNDADLDQLRRHGDPLDDEFVKPIEHPDDDPQVFARGFVTRGAPYQMLSSNQPDIEFPEWVDAAQIAKGQEFFKKHAMQIAAALFSASLPKAYTAAKGARVLVATAELVSDVTRRIAETGRLLLDVMLPDPNGLAPGSRGYKTVLTVRGFHSAIRAMLADQEPWYSEWDETPINQEDLLGTLTTFTVIVIETLEKMDVTVEPEERDAYLHTWLVVGFLLGIDYDLLRLHPFNKTLQPLTYFEMQLVRDAIFRRHAAPSPSGQILIRALINAQEDALPRALRPLPPAAIRRFIGDDAADLLQIPPAGPARVALNAFGPLGSAVDWVGQGRVLTPRLADMSAEMFRRWIGDEPGALRDWSTDGLDPKLGLGPVIDLRTPKEPAMWEDESVTTPLLVEERRRSMS
jgi:ER-bound oxygenase mpaB/B'/Rubber oxygenase, catalytic domain